MYHKLIRTEVEIIHRKICTKISKIRQKSSLQFALLPLRRFETEWMRFYGAAIYTLRNQLSKQSQHNLNCLNDLEGQGHSKLLSQHRSQQSKQPPRSRTLSQQVVTVSTAVSVEIPHLHNLNVSQRWDSSQPKLFSCAIFAILFRLVSKKPISICLLANLPIFPWFSRENFLCMFYNLFFPHVFPMFLLHFTWISE